MKTASRNKIKNKVMDALIEEVDVNVPEALVGSEIAVSYTHLTLPTNREV